MYSSKGNEKYIYGLFSNSVTAREALTSMGTKVRWISRCSRPVMEKYSW